MIFKAMRTLAWALALDSFMSGLWYILYSVYQGSAWLLGFLNEGLPAVCSLSQADRAFLILTRLLSRMKIQELIWAKGQMTGPSPKPRSDPLTSWIWLMRWVSSILLLFLPPPPASECALPQYCLWACTEPGCEMSAGTLGGSSQASEGGGGPPCMTLLVFLFFRS